MGFAQLVIGPAGSGKSTYCSSLHQHCETIGRTVHIVNLDPAAEHFDYPVAIDIRELISLDDVMDELGLGPNGGLIYCMEHLEENLDDWLAEELENYLDDDYLVFDCPGQIELFSHVPVLKNFVDHLRHKNFSVCAVYLLDSQFMTDVTKYISGCMASLSAMVQLELPHVNVLSKMDLVKNKRDIEDYLEPEPRLLLAELNQQMAPKFKKLNKVLAELVAQFRGKIGRFGDLKAQIVVGIMNPGFFLNPRFQYQEGFLYSDSIRSGVTKVIERLAPNVTFAIEATSEVDNYNMVNFLPLDLRKASSIQYILSCIDNCIQYGEDADVKVKDFNDPDADDDS